MMESAKSSEIALQDDSVRDHLISTAIKFLQNPRVRPTTFAQKKAFLKNKGLTDGEIEIVCQKSGLYEDKNNNVGGKNGAVDLRGNYTIAKSPTRTSLLLKAMDVANMIALISIGSYSLYSLWKNYIAPRIFGTRSRLEKNYEKLLESIKKLNETVTELKEIIRETHVQSTQISRTQSSIDIQDVKKEISSIKSLLLSRSQFPPPSPSIPSWQMIESTEMEVEESGSSRRRAKKDKPERSTGSGAEPEDSPSERGDDGDAPGTMRKHPSLDSNNGFCSGSSCEVVFVGKHDSSDPDHSDD